MPLRRLIPDERVAAVSSLSNTNFTDFRSHVHRKECRWHDEGLAMAEKLG